MDKIQTQWLMEHENLKKLDSELFKYGMTIADLHLYYLPLGAVKAQKPSFEARWFEQEEILQFKGFKGINEAFAFDKNHPDVLACGAYDKGKLIGMAGASRDGEKMWQIGIDVFDGFKGQGVGAALTSLLKDEVMKRGAVPFYGTAVSHIASQRLAQRAGFKPYWAELYTCRI